MPCVLSMLSIVSGEFSSSTSMSLEGVDKIDTCFHLLVHALACFFVTRIFEFFHNSRPICLIGQNKIYEKIET